jgi:hypothetical protein
VSTVNRFPLLHLGHVMAWFATIAGYSHIPLMWGMLAVVCHAQTDLLPAALAENIPGSSRTSGKSDWDRSPTAVEARLRRDTEYLASDELEGRGVRTRGLDAAAEYIAKEFTHAGLNTSLYGGTPFHEFRLFSANPTGTVQSLSIRTGSDAPEVLQLGEDYTSLMVSPSKSFQADAVFVGYGITDKKLGYDDYAGIDVRGKAVVMLRNEPQGPQADRVFDGSQLTPHAYLLEKIANAYSHGAIAVVLCTETRGLRPSHDGDQEATHADPLLNVELTSGIGTETLPVVHCRRVHVERWIQTGLGRRLNDIEETIERTVQPASGLLRGVVLQVSIAMTRPGRTLRNVVGSMAGTGALADESLVIGAHYDHLGRGGWGSLAIGAAEEVHNGADDNASGTAVLMELARLLAAHKSPARRQVIFIAFSGEELGLYGSKRYVEDPLVPLDKTVAMLNLDMVGRLRNQQLTVYGTGTAAEWPEWLEAAATPQQLKMIAKPSGFGPSDHASFHEHGLPVLHFFTGFHPEYHRPTDDAEKLNIEGMRQITQLVLDLATRVVTTPARPRATTAEQTMRLALTDSLEGVLQGGIIARPLRLGVTLAVVEGGLRIQKVEPDGLAAEAGLREGDVLKAWNNEPLTTVRDVQQSLARSKSGESTTLTFDRVGIVRQIELKF